MRSLLVPSLLLGAACSSAYADRVAVPAPATPMIALDTAPAKVRAPYDVQVVREDGENAPTYALKDRLYGQLARVGKALASPHRLELLELLAQGERSVDSLASETSMSIASTLPVGPTSGAMRKL